MTAAINEEGLNFPEDDLQIRFQQVMETATEQSKQIDSLMTLATQQQASIQQLVELVDRLANQLPQPNPIGPFEWLPHSQYTTAYPLITAAITAGQPKQKTLESILGISKGGSVNWFKASQDWDRLKAALYSQGL